MNRVWTVFFYFVAVNCTGQVPSEKVHYKKQEPYAAIWDSIMTAYRSDSTELTIPFTEELMSMALAKADSSQYVHGIKYQGYAHRKMGNYVQSIDRFKKVMLYARHHQDSLLLAAATDQIGIMYTFMGNMSEAQPYVIETAEIYDAVGQVEDIANANNGLAIFYYDIGQKDKAIEIYNVALKQYEEIDDTMGRANIHANLGMLYLDEDKFELAEENIQMQGKLDTMMNSQWGLGFYHDFMGSLRRKQGRLKEALRWKKSSLEIRKNLASHYNRAESISGLANVYLALGEYEKSIFNAKEILKRKEDHRSLSQQMGAYSLLSSAYEKKKNYKLSLNYHKQYKLMSDSIYNRDMISEMETKDALYEKAKQDQDITRLNANKVIAESKIKNKNKVIAIGGVAFGLISLLLFFLYQLLQKYKTQKNQLAKTLGEKDILLREIHHRVKNNLQLISSLLTLQGRSIDDEVAIKAINEGKSRVRSMALIHQDLYHKKNLTEISVKTYMDKLIQELFDTYRIDKGRIELQTYIEDIDLDVDTVIPLGLIINELITNCLKYAFPDNNSGLLMINLQETRDSLVLQIKDDGVGYNPDKIRENSFGSTLVDALTEQLDGVMKVNHESGTSITIEIKDYKKKSTE